MKPLIVDLPFPSLDCIEKDLVAASIIASAYAGTHSEITSILQYTYHSFYFDNLNDKSTAEVLMSIAVAEMKHLEILGKLLLRLGREPFFGLYYPLGKEFYNTSAVANSKTPQKMLLDNIAGELLAIEDYKKMIATLNNEQVASVITRIKMDEELHVLALKSQMEKFCKN